jgi:hypothetical protein
MITKIKTIHEEEYSDKSKSLGILLNYSTDDNWQESFIYVYKNENYIFFNTMIDMFDYLFYGENKMKRAYLSELEFDKYYDASDIEGHFSDKLSWICG